ncbi:MAG: DUF1731 domain-containing protein [Planctomycetales bacterium]
MNRLFDRAIFKEAMEGVYLATAPNPVSNATFMRELRRTIRVPIGLPSTSWMVRWGAPLVMRTDPELALCGRYCVPARLEEERFRFEFPDLQLALANLFCRDTTKYQLDGNHHAQRDALSSRGA